MQNNKIVKENEKKTCRTTLTFQTRNSSHQTRSTTNEKNTKLNP